MQLTTSDLDLRQQGRSKLAEQWESSIPTFQRDLKQIQATALQLFDVLRLRKGDRHSELTTIWKCYVMGAWAGPDLLISMIYGREGAPPP